MTIVSQYKYMRDKHYNLKSFRLSDEVYNELKIIKEQYKLSWNLIFKQLLIQNKESKIKL